MKSNSQPPFLNQFLGADFKLSFILPIKPKHFPFLRDGGWISLSPETQGTIESGPAGEMENSSSPDPIFSPVPPMGSIPFFFRHFECRKVFPNHSVENFSFHSFSNFSKSNPRSITIPSIASIEDKNSV